MFAVQNVMKNVIKCGKYKTFHTHIQDKIGQFKKYRIPKTSRNSHGRFQDGESTLFPGLTNLLYK